MHPQIVRDEPGSCPICGMALEPMTVMADEGPDPELISMTRRFWIGLALTAPLLVFMIGDMLPGDAEPNADPITGQAAWYDLRVRVEKAAAAEAGRSAPDFTLPRPPPSLP